MKITMRTIQRQMKETTVDSSYDFNPMNMNTAIVQCN